MSTIITTSLTLAFQAPGPRIAVNTTTVRDHGAVNVSWTGVSLEALRPMHVAFSLEQEDDKGEPSLEVDQLT